MATTTSNEITIRLPEYHPSQKAIAAQAKRYNALACGRRWGKSKFLTRRMATRALRGQYYGYFAPSYKVLREVFREAAWRLEPCAKILKSENRIEVATGGLIEFWTLEDEDAGRSRRYHEIGVDEAGLVANLEQIFNNAIRPTLTDFRGEAWFAGTPKGRNFFHTAFAFGQDPSKTNWASWQEPTSNNPYIPADEVEAARLEMPERAFQQEYLAEFLEDAGGVFRGVRDVVATGIKTRHGESPYSIGVDLAKVEDFTVIAVCDCAGNQIYFERFNQISWERQIARITAAYQMFPGATVWIDSTGVGDPIFERLRNSGMTVKGYTLSNTSKEALIDNLAMRIEQKTTSLLDFPEQTNELLAYQYELTASRNVRMNAPEGMHDDTVIALALALWGTTKKRQIEFLG